MKNQMKTKQVKWVCSTCNGTTRMLNRQTSLSLCPKCLNQMVPLIKRPIRKPKVIKRSFNDNRTEKGLRCTRCGEYERNLTIIKNELHNTIAELCSKCVGVK